MSFSTNAIARSCLVMLAASGLSACFATQQDIQVLQSDLALIRAEAATADSLRRIQLDGVVRTMRSVNDSMAALTARMTRFRADMTSNIAGIDQQLLVIQELTGQSQRRLQEMRASLEERQQAQQQALFEAPPAGSREVPVTKPGTTPNRNTRPGTKPSAPADAARDEESSDTADTPAPPQRVVSETPGPNQLFQIAREQLMQGSYTTARSAFQDLLAEYPKSDMAPEALFYVGETYAAEGQSKEADSVYARVVSQYPKSSRAATALYKRAVLAQTAGKTADAKRLFQQVMKQYPRSDEADLSIDRFRALEQAE